MLSTRIWNRCLVRTFTKSVARKNVDKSKTPETTSNLTSTTTSTTTAATQGQQPATSAQDLIMDIIPTEWDRRFLVWSGRYKTPEDIPRRVSLNTMNAVKTELRIKGATLLMVVVLFGCYIITRIGKAKASKGDTLVSRERERERKIREEGRQSLLKETPK